MPIIRLTKDETEFTVALMQSAITDYQLKNLSTRGKYSDMLKSANSLVSIIKEQARGNKRNIKDES